MDIPEELAARVDYPGDCSKDIDRLLEVEEIQAELGKLKPDDLKRELQEYGAWTEEELNNHSDNLTRILWIACCNINEGNI
jgi:hypothetical protein